MTNGSKKLDLGLGRQEVTNNKSGLGYKSKSKIKDYRVHFEYDTKPKEFSRTRVVVRY